MNLLLEVMPFLLNGLCVGLLFGLVALGFMLIIGVMEVVNLAHGSLFALGGYLALTIANLRIEPLTALQAWPQGYRLCLALILAPLLVGMLGMLLERCLRRTYGKDVLYGILLTFGAALVLEEGIRVCWGPAEQEYISLVPALLSQPVTIFELQYSSYKIFAAAFALLIIFLLWLFLEWTPYGAMIKAGAHDSEMVRALGIDISRLRMLVFGLGAALAAIAGIVMVPIWGLRPHVGVDAVIPAFIVIVIGGVGSFWGAVLASLVLGTSYSLAQGYFPAYATVSIYLILILVVSVRSRGFFGRKSVLDK